VSEANSRNESPIGKRIARAGTNATERGEIVGVVADVSIGQPRLNV
jgi:hypothetical protein